MGMGDEEYMDEGPVTLTISTVVPGCRALDIVTHIQAIAEVSVRCTGQRRSSEDARRQKGVRVA
jgi:hypothetical protein